METTKRTMYQELKDARDSLKERMDYMDEDERERFFEDDEPHDVIFEVADSSVPVYTGDIMALAADDIDLATNEPDLGPAFDGKPTPVNIIAANIFEAIEADLWEYWRELKDEHDTK